LNKKADAGGLCINAFFIISSLCCLIPFILLVSISLSGEKDIYEFGYRLIPKRIDFTAYAYVMKNPSQIIQAYKITVLSTVTGTVLSVLIMASAAYGLSVNGFRFKRGFSFYLFFTMLFSGGLVPSYILITKYLNLGNNFWVLVLPSLVNPWYIFLIRTFFQGVPSSLRESAKIDGASEFIIFARIMLPLSKPVIATIALMTALVKWNDWYNVLLYITDEKLMTLQYLLQRIMLQIELLKDYMTAGLSGVNLDDAEVPSETIRMAMAVVAAGPMLIVFPFFQKYFARGLTVGSVKG
jgi:putative aldouronate transport system permease protein